MDFDGFDRGIRWLKPEEFRQLTWLPHIRLTAFINTDRIFHGCLHSVVISDWHGPHHFTRQRTQLGWPSAISTQANSLPRYMSVNYVSLAVAMRIIPPRPFSLCFTRFRSRR
jgi:hypothetical protein